MAEIIDLDGPKVEKIAPIGDKKETIPIGYIPIELSTMGKLGVPKVIHCRNFSTADLVDLSMFNDDSLPEHLISALNAIIYESNRGVDVTNFPDKIVIELLVRVYINFFTPILTNIRFPWNEEDIQWLEEQGKHDVVESLREGKFVPHFDLNVAKDVKINTLGEEVKDSMTIKKNSPEGIQMFSAKFLSYPKYGDVLTLRKAVEAKFSEEDKKFARIRQTWEMMERYLSEGRDVSALEPISDYDYRRWQMYEATKAKYAAKAAEALYLIKYNETDLSKASLDDRIKYINSPLFDIHLSKLVGEQYQKLNFGLEPMIEVKNPITGKVCQRRFTFRFLDILQAIQSSESNGYDISYDN